LKPALPKVNLKRSPLKTSAFSDSTNQKAFDGSQLRQRAELLCTQASAQIKMLENLETFLVESQSKQSDQFRASDFKDRVSHQFNETPDFRKQRANIFTSSPVQIQSKNARNRR